MKCKKGYKKLDGKCKKTNPRSNKNKLNIDNLWIIITIFGILVIAGIFFYGGKAGWFKSLSVIDDTNLISFLNMPETISPTCSLSFSPNSIWAGDRTTGTIVDGKNKLCHVYVLQDGNWLSVYQGYTDSNGVLINTRTIHLPGDYIFRAVCDLNDNNRVDTSDCLTNQADLTVIPRPDEPDEPPFDEPDGYDVGDVVGSSSSSGTFGGMGGFLIPIDLSGVQTGGPCRLGARILTEWDYALSQTTEAVTRGFSDGTDCLSNYISEIVIISGFTEGVDYIINNGCIDWSPIGGEPSPGSTYNVIYKYSGCDALQGREGIIWEFYDSSGLTWTRTDISPVALGNLLCPLNWDGTTEWQFGFKKILGLPDCQIQYSYNLEIFVCECD